MATPDSDRSADTWAPEAVAERTEAYVRRTGHLGPDEWVSETVSLSRIVRVDKDGRVVSTRIVRAYPGGQVAADVERMVIREALSDAEAEKFEGRRRCS